jgi:tetratricopeptide (TPR) repeat protein
LRSARQLVANTLVFLGYEPVWQDIFGTEEGDLREMLRGLINECKGVVQLVGNCYGAEPSRSDEQFGRVSYTQYEALYARERGKKIWYLFIDETFPIDACPAEATELVQLQQSYRQRVQSGTQLFHPLTSREGLEASVLKLRNDLTHLRRGVKQWATGVAVLLLVIGGMVIWLLRSQRETTREVGETKKAMAEMTEEMARLRKTMMQYARVETKVREAQAGADPAGVQERIYAALSKETGIDVNTLRKLPDLAERLKVDAASSAFERANAAYVAKDYPQAEKLALKAAKTEDGGAGGSPGNVLESLKLAALSAQRAIHYARAMEHLRAAEKLTDRQRAGEEWADVQHLIADVLIDQGKYADAENALRQVVEVRTGVVGPENPDTLRSRNNLGLALLRGGKFAEAEREYRKVADLQAKVLGPEDPDTLMSRTGLATALFRQAKFVESEKESREVLELSEKVLGPEHPDTLRSRNYLAATLESQNKYAEAEAECRTVLELRRKTLGPEHPDTIASRSNLAGTLMKQGRYAEAEQEYRELIELNDKVLGAQHPQAFALRRNFVTALLYQKKYDEAAGEARQVLAGNEKALGAEHPETLNSRADLAYALMNQGKLNEAESIFREVIKLQERVLGPEHPDTLSSYSNLAYVLARLGKNAEAVQFARRAATSSLTVLGADHPSTKRYEKLLQDLEARK